MNDNLFELSEEYDQMLNQGISLSGEDKHFFLHGRIADLKKKLQGKRVEKILDFGCGIGDSSVHLAKEFQGAKVVGVDTAVNAIEYANRTFGSSMLSFQLLHDFNSENEFDLCYVNGVFHHIIPKQRGQALKSIFQSLKQDGLFALFENNPLNPGARLVMSRILFDAEAQTLKPKLTRQIILEAGFGKILDTRFLFYFPRVLAALRPIEPMLVHVPMGAQYYVLASKK